MDICKKVLIHQKIDEKTASTITNNIFMESNPIDIAINFTTIYDVFPNETPINHKGSIIEQIELCKKYLQQIKSYRFLNFRLFAQLINDHISDRDIAKQYATKLEESIHNEFSDPIMYNSRCGTVAQLLNIHSQSHIQFQSATIIINLIETDQPLVGITDTAICKDLHKEEIELVKLKQNQNIKRKTSSLYKCPKCGHSETLIEEKITRSLDEATTIFCTCVYCNNIFQR